MTNRAKLILKLVDTAQNKQLNTRPMDKQTAIQKLNDYQYLIGKKVRDNDNREELIITRVFVKEASDNNFYPYAELEYENKEDSDNIIHDQSIASILKRYSFL